MRLILAIALMMPGLASSQVVGGHTAGHVQTSRLVLACPLTSSLVCGTKTASITRATSAWCLQSDGQYTEATSGNPCFGVGGLSVWPAVTNYWQNSLAADSSATVGTPTVTADQGSGPFSTYAGGAEADQLSDDDAGALEGIESDSAGTADDTYTCSAWLASGTSTDYTLGILKDGVSLGTCTGTDLTSTYARKSCSQAAGGVATTDITCTITVGDAAADTGTILVSGLHLEKSGFAGRPCLATGATATCNADTVTLPTDGFPTSVGGFSITARLDTVTTDVIQAGYDSRAAGVDGAYLRAEASDASIELRLDGPGGVTVLDSGAVAQAVDTDYLFVANWGGGRGRIRRFPGFTDGDLSSENPAAHGSSVYLGANRFSDQYIAGFIRDFQVRRR